MSRIHISNAAHITINGYEVKRLWYNGYIVWEFNPSNVNIRLSKTTAILTASNNYEDVIEIFTRDTTSWVVDGGETTYEE